MTADAEAVLKLTLEKEKGLVELLSKLQALRKIDANVSLDSYESSSEVVNELLVKNKKLKYRLGILKSAIQEQKNMSQNKKLRTEKTDSSPSGGVQDILTAACSEALNAAFPDVGIQDTVQVAGSPKFGDYQFNAALKLVKILKAKGMSMPPSEIGKKILSAMPQCPLIDRSEVAPAGYINLFLNKEFCRRIITNQVINGITSPPKEKRLRVIVDFSSPNIAKEMHVGHLRSTIIGDSICRLLEFLGHDVLRLNHVGDWGTQFGMLIAHLQDKFPDYLTISPPIADLQAFYKESKLRFDEDAEFKARAYDCVVKLQSGNADYTKAWNLICDVSRKEFQQIYDRLDVKLIERGESFYQKYMNKLVEDLDSNGLLEEDDGRKIMFGLEEGQIPMTVVKSGGGYTYDTSDLAALKQRIEEEKADWIIYVTDLGQLTHFKVVFSCAQKAGFWDPSKVRIDHVGFGVVLGEDKKKFKTRSGDTVRLVDLLDEGIQRAELELKERNRQSVLSEEEINKAKTSVAYGCIKYADLSHNRCNDYVFSFDKMLEDKGNTAVYLLYSLTRIRSIARTANVTPVDIQKAAQTELVAGEHEKEWKLIKVLLRFNDVLMKITKDLLLHSLCEYLFEISSAFSEFYDSCYCIEKDSSGKIQKVFMNRVMLCEATALTMEKCFNILGIKTLSRM